MRKIFTARTLMIASLLVLFVGAAFGQMGAIQGRVVGEDGKPVPDAIIKIVRQDIRGAYQTRTNRRGEYLHSGLPAGRATNYSVTLEIGGQDVDTRKNIVVSFGDQTAVHFDLALKNKQQEAMAAGSLTEDQTRGLSNEQKEQLEQAMKERAVQLARNKALSDAFNQGMEAMKAQQYRPAVDAFAKAAELDPTQIAVWGQLAEAYSALSQQKAGADEEALLVKSVEAYQKAMALKPDDAALHNNFGLVLVRAKRIAEAQAELEKAAQLDAPNAGKFYYNMGAVMMNTGQMDAAGEAFRKAAAASPTYAPAWYQYGIYLLGKAQIAPDGKIQPLEGTKEAFDMFLKLEPAGAIADQARAIMATLDQVIETRYSSPDATRKLAKK